jgi:hypothetical protein
MQLLLNCYQNSDRAGFGLVIDYTREPVPSFVEADATWANTFLQQQELR